MTGCDRRTFLTGAGGGALLGLIGCGSTSSPTAGPRPGPRGRDGPIHAEVVVIGAGVSGLAAADALAEKDVDVRVVEARTRIGGRVHTSHRLLVATELGAAWIHGPDGNPLTPLARQAGMRTRTTDDDAAVLVGASSPADRRRAEEESELAAEYGADRDVLSPDLYDADDEYPGGDALVLNGYDRLARLLATDLDVRTGTPVTLVRDDPARSRVVVTFTNGRHLRARGVVLTVPLGVLQADGIRLDPDLDGSAPGALRRLGSGRVQKSVARVRRAVLGADGRVPRPRARPRGHRQRVPVTAALPRRAGPGRFRRWNPS